MSRSPKIKLNNNKAFTIVELLIVIVVIAILAAVTLVSYNGIQARAKASAAQSLLSQTVDKVKLYLVDHNDVYPSTLADAGITDVSNLQYTGSSSSFCITATYQNVSYYEGTSVTTPTAGACPGHGVNGGGTIVNLITNPTGSNTSLMWFNGSYSSFSSLSSGGQSGSDFVRVVASTDAASSAGPYRYNIYVESNKIYTASAYVRTSSSRQVRMCIEWKTESSSSAGGSLCSDNVTTNSSGWVRMSATSTSPSTASKATVTVYGAINTGDWVDIDSMMFTEGSTLYDYADPTTNSSWIWNGTANASTSTGPAP